MPSICQNPLIISLALALTVSSLACSESKSSQCQTIIEVIDQQERQFPLGIITARSNLLKIAEIKQEAANDLTAIKTGNKKLNDLKARLIKTYQTWTEVTRELAEFVDEEGGVTTTDPVEGEIYARYQANEEQEFQVTKEITLYCSN